MKEKINIIRALMILGLTLASMAASRQGLAQNCPSGCRCGCTYCGSCNAGSFWVCCVCCPQPGYTVCDTSDGSCALQQCNQCCTVGAGGEHCNFNGCPGYSCPPNFSPQFSMVNAWLQPVAFTTAHKAGTQCEDAEPQLADLPCEGCASRRIDLGPARNGATGELLIPNDVPVDFSGLHVILEENGGIGGGSYTVRNGSQTGLVTLIVVWKFEHEGSGLPLTSTEVIDSWATDSAFLPPGGLKDYTLNVRVSTPKDQGVRHVTATVVYAEFTDGTRVGPSVSTLAPKLASRREAILSAYGELLAKIQAGAPDAELDQFVRSTRGLKWLLFVRATDGWEGVAAKISKPRKLTP